MNANLIITILLCVYTYYFMKNVSENTKKDGPLTKNEKIQVIILLLINTLLTWIILRFGWKDTLPTKAKQVTKYLLRIIGILVGIAVLGILVSVLLVAVNPRRQIEKARNTIPSPQITVTQTQ
jgi:uncharacterized membrane protein required for colicin V production